MRDKLVGKFALIETSISLPSRIVKMAYLVKHIYMYHEL